MAKLHIVSVGGTGHKVLASVIHLAACGAFRSRNTNQVNEISVISIDADNGNGNLVRATKTFLGYKKLYQALHRDDSNLINIDSVVPSLNISLFQDDQKSLAKAFNLAQHNATDEDELIRFLYTDAEIDAEFEEGFYGHTSIGAVIARDILWESKAWADFKKQINENDQVVVTGSIFGGTGASCIPVVLEELKAKKKDGVGLATIILTPYFQALGELKKDGTLQPDSNNFNIKAKAALNYYEIEKKLDATHALYVIGEPDVNFSYEIASRGAAGQCNKAHPIELFAATAILDFVRNNADRRKGKVYVAKRAFINSKYCYTWKMLQDVDKDLHLLMQTFTKAAIFYNKVLYPQLVHKNSAGIWEGFYDDGQSSLQTKIDESNNFYYENVHTYLDLFVEWILETHQVNSKKLNPETKKLERVQDTRVRLFNAQFLDLFSSKECGSGKVKNFEKLVFPEEEGRTAERILAELNYNPPESGKGFPALFATLKNLLEEKENKPHSRRRKPVPESEIKETEYLSQENNVVLHVPTGNSFWVECPTATILGDIAEGLPNTEFKAYTVNDVSIPSPWSIFIMNEMSLTRDKFKGLNEYAYNQWCGLIALLVLRRLNRYEQGHDLKVQKLEMDGNDRFLRTIIDLSAPKSHIFGVTEPDWHNCAVVKLGKHTIAFLAHNTLVCPAFSMSKEAVTKLHQFAPTIVGSNGEFMNPQDYFADPPNDTNNKKSKYALSLVLARLKTEISNQAKIREKNRADRPHEKKKNDDEILNFMVKLFDQYIKDLGHVAEQDDVSLPREEEFHINSVSDVFEQLCIKEGDVKDLPFVLKNTLPGRRVALLSLQIAGMSGAELQTSYITPGLVYSEIRMDNIRDYAGTEKDGIELVWDQDLLCDSMVMREKEPGSENAFHSLQGAVISDYEVVWPVSEKLLELYTPEQLNKMLSIKKEKDSVFVTLTLEVMGKMRTHSVTKAYRTKHIWDDDRRIDDTGVCSIFETRRLPFWAVWPYAKIINNQDMSVWQRYTFFCVDHVYNNAPVFTIEPFFARGSSGGLKKRNLSTINENAKEFYYRRCTELPAAFRIIEQTGGRPLYRGAIFLNPPQEKRLQTSTWNVGVDFGTTSTSVYYNAGVHSQPDFLQLLTEYHWKGEHDVEPETAGGKLETSLEILCNSGDKDFLDQYFIDEQCLSQKGYTTTFEELENTTGSTDDIIFDSGRIFWHNYKTFKNVNAVEGRREHLKSGIKWENDKKWAARYLNQMLTQISYRAIEQKVSEIHWFFSYPTAFSSDDKTSFNERLKMLIGALKYETGLKHDFEGGDGLLTESVAAAIFFRNKTPMFSTFLCLDIGGGTSDISIWVRRDLKFQTSVKFASRDMFVTPLQNLLERQSVLDKVCSSNVSDGIHTMLRYGHKDVGKDSIPFLIETVLFEYLSTFKKRLDDLQAEDKAALHHFVYLVYIAYAGLIFYLVNIIVVLLNNDFESDRIDREITEIVLGLSGKGSKLTEWIENYCRPIYKTAESLIREKTGCEITFNPQFQADAAKTETAYGLICDLNENGRQNTQSDKIKPKIFMGCNVRVKNDQETKNFAKDDLIQSYDSFFKKPEKLNVQFDDLSLADFDQFIVFLDRVAEEADNEVEAVPRDWYNDKQKRALLSKMTEYFNNQILEKEHRFDPPFIVMLKVFLKEYSGYLYGKK
jgi:hypothetical protein